MSFHVYFDKQLHKKFKKKIKHKKLKAWILLNQMRTEKQTCGAALRHTIYLFLALYMSLAAAVPQRGICPKIFYCPPFPLKKKKKNKDKNKNKKKQKKKQTKKKSNVLNVDQTWQFQHKNGNFYSIFFHYKNFFWCFVQILHFFLPKIFSYPLPP